MRPFIPKDDERFPDHYGIIIHYVTGKKDDFEGLHYIIKETSTIEIVTKDDVWNLIPISSILRIEFDKRFSTVVALRDDARRKNNSSAV